jgi:hypothetical protein
VTFNTHKVKEAGGGEYEVKEEGGEGEEVREDERYA